MLRTVHAVALAAACAVVAGSQSQEDPRIARSRELAMSLQQALAARLTATIASDGPIAAIEVCNTAAPEIAARISAEGEARVGRTSLKVRNARNAPDATARATLERFENDWARDKSAPPETFTTNTDGTARYMRAIPTQPLCVTCHGTSIAPDLAAAIAARYPNDAATGFAVGDLRGAFLIEWPVQTR